MATMIIFKNWTVTDQAINLWRWQDALSKRGMCWL